VWRACLSRWGSKRLNLRTFDVGSDELAITSGPPRGARKKFPARSANAGIRSRSRHVAVKILSHVWFSCALFVCSFSLTRMAQGFLSCCGAVTGNGFPGHTRPARADADAVTGSTLNQFAFCAIGK
jgi:hypothetical protein